ncbi:hypothetical protein PITCH_A400006 [uncultured Desulfobacterium sp.]|uniref:Beta-barrel porin 2 n=1 Tax=uncultured Desulfobacterium sp. TaxID=201089 RepID=A0A445N044_9BACT|nr:hypothetical protein PITCH_A400006 [uncultured Desulfobacterium sp.]
MKIGFFKFGYGLCAGLCVIIFSVMLHTPSFGQIQMELTPSVSLSEEYDDNLDLESSNEESDYITTISPGVNFSLLSENTQLGLMYFPGFVWYADNTEYDTTTHDGSLTLGQAISEHLRFDFTDTIVKSDEPLESTEGVEGVRHTRDTYWRNTGNADLRYIFGPENSLRVGYSNSYLKNEAEDVDDGTIQRPNTSILYHFDIRNAVELNYGYTKANFWRDELLPGDEAESDYTGHEPGLRYIYTFSPHTTGSLGYVFTTRRFKDDTEEEDYDVHDGTVGLEHAFSSDLSASASVGYFIQKNDFSDDEDGYSYDAALTKTFRRGSMSIGGRGGWDESTLQAESRGFTKFWSADTSMEYQILEPLTGYAAGSYRHDKDEDDQKWITTRGNCGLRWEFLRWYSLSLDYSYAERDDDVDMDDYSVNRVMMIFTASRLIRW